jgi:hypothetical protein
MANPNPVNNNKAARGKNKRAGNAPKLSPEQQRDKLAKQLGIKPKTREFVDELLSTKGISQTDAYLKVHPKASRVTAKNAASKLLQKPAVIGYKDSAVGKAKRRIVSLVDSTNESIALKAAQEVIDRNEGKATQKSEHTNQSISVRLDVGGLRIGAHSLSNGLKEPEPVNNTPEAEIVESHNT